MLNDMLLTILLFLIIVYVHKEFNMEIKEDLNISGREIEDRSFDIGDTVYFKTDINPIQNDKILCATTEKSAKDIIVKGKVCSINGNKAVIKYTSIINPNQDAYCLDKYTYNDVRSIPMISRTDDGLNNSINSDMQQKYIGGIKNDGSPSCGVEGTIYKRKNKFEKCKTSDECGVGLYCREGDNRCLNDDDCNMTNVQNRTNNSCKKLPKKIMENSFPIEVDLNRLMKNMPLNLKSNEQKRRDSSENSVLNAYYKYDKIADIAEDANTKIENDLKTKNIVDYTRGLASSFAAKAVSAQRTLNTSKQYGEQQISNSNKQLTRQNSEKNINKNKVDEMIRTNSQKVGSLVDINTDMIRSNMQGILNSQFTSETSSGITNITNKASNIKQVEDTYNNILNQTKSNFDMTYTVPIMSGIEDNIKDTLKYKNSKLPREDLGNYRGVLVRRYNSNKRDTNGIHEGTLVDERIIPSINYFIAIASDSFFDSSKLNQFTYLEFFGNIKFPNNVETVEFNILAGAGLRFFFGGELLIDEHKETLKIDHYSRLIYILPNSNIPYKIIAYEGSNLTNTHLILKWRINRKGNFNIIPSNNFFLPNLKYD